MRAVLKQECGQHGNPMKLDLAPLIDAVARLQEGLTRYECDITDTQIRDGLILRLKFTYEVTHKML